MSYRHLLTALWMGTLGLPPVLAGTQPIDWSQPPLVCIEEMVPMAPTVACLDLSQVANPSIDFPAGITPEEKSYWTDQHPADLSMCRAGETNRRYGLDPTSVTPAAAEIAWMKLFSQESTSGKVDSIYSATAEQDMPPHVLLGALMQESLLAELGVSTDGGNFSCGVGQLNVQEWCEFAQSRSGAEQIALGWPVAEIAAYQATHPPDPASPGAPPAPDFCHSPLVNPSYLKPFYEIGLSRLGGVPAYRLLPEHLKGITRSQVEAGFPAGTAEDQGIRFLTSQAFAAHCSDYRFGIPAKAFTLRRIFDSDVPDAMKKVQLYQPGNHFQKKCLTPYRSKYYPLHTGWLMADAVYNAGSTYVQAVEYYLRLDSTAIESPSTWKSFSPQKLVQSLYGAGRYHSSTDLLYYKDQAGYQNTLTWYKTCVVQRHIANVAQFGALPGSIIATSYEDPTGCRKSTVDSSGKLIPSIPPERRKMSGQIPVSGN